MKSLSYSLKDYVSGLIGRDERELLVKHIARNTSFPALVNQQPLEELDGPWHKSNHLYIHDYIPPPRSVPVGETSCLPHGLRMLRTHAMVSDGTQSLLESVNEGIQRQLRWFHSDGFSLTQADKAWTKLENQVCGYFVPEHWDIAHGWLRWGMLAYIFLSYSYSHRRISTVFERLNRIVRRLDCTKRSSNEQSTSDHEREVRRRWRRNCAVWVLMCLAAACARRQKDQGGTKTGLEGPMDLAITTLMDRVRTLFNFDDNEPRDLDVEWDIVQAVVTQFWCPQWMLGDWERMWKDKSAERFQATAYYRVYHHWHSAILPEDIPMT